MLFNEKIAFFNEKVIKSGDTLSGEGKLTIMVTNDQDKSSTAEITITNTAIFGLESIKDLQIDTEVDLLEGLTFAEGVELIKTEIEYDGKTTTIPDAHHYTPEFP